MSNATSQGRAATSDSPASPTQAASNAAEQRASSAPAASASAVSLRSSSPPQQQPASDQPVSKAPASSAPAAAAPTQFTPKDASPPDQNPPTATMTTSPPRNAASTAETNPAAAATSSAAAAPGAATSSDAATPSSVVTVTPGDTSTSVQVVTSTTTRTPGGMETSTSSTSTPTPIDPSSDGASGLSQPFKVAIGVVVPIAAIAILAILGLFWCKKRIARQEAEEERRKEVEDYAYNPNADPTMPSAGRSADNSYEMKEEGGSGYRGWGYTAAPGSMGRKTSTTVSGGGMVGAYSDPSSPTRGNPPEPRSGEPLLDGSRSPEGEILGAMGPLAANNRAGDMRRGPSNASSSYSVGARSEGSDGGMYGNGSNYEQYGQNPYGDQRPQDPASQAVIRDNPARRNTRIENSSHYPQQSAGIAQNF